MHLCGAVHSCLAPLPPPLQRLGELAVSTAPGARLVGLEALKRTLADRAVFYR